MRRTSVHKTSMEVTDLPNKEEIPRKKSSAGSPPLKFRKMSTDLPKNGRIVEENNNRKESLKTVFVVSKETSTIEKEYEPYDHRDVKHPTSYFETLVHLLKGSIGTGVLAMPYAFSNTGYIFGTLGTLFIGILSTHSIHILISSSYELCKRNKQASMTYSETAKAAFDEGPKELRSMAKFAPGICKFFLVTYLVGSAGIYVLFISSNLRDVVNHYLDPADRWDVRWYCFFILGPLILLNCIRGYKFLAPLSAIANVLTTLSFVVVFVYIFSDLPDLSLAQSIRPINKIPLFLSTVMFAMEAIGVVLPLENEMAKPKEFGSFFGVINCAMLPITLLYTTVGLFGYLKYGDNVEGSITLSLPQDEIMCQAVRVMLAVGIFFTHALLIQPAIDVLWHDVLKAKIKERHLLWEYVTRISMVLVTFLLAVTVPFLELFISLIGSLCLSMLGLMFPAVIQTCTFWYDLSGTRFVLFFLKNMSISLLAAYGLVFGVKTTLQEMIEKF